MPGFCKFVKTFSIVLVVTLLAQDLSLAAPTFETLGQRFDASADRRWARELLPSIPESVATVEDAWRGGARTVVLVQDAHTNDSGQMNSARLLDAIYSKPPAGLSRSIFLEAGSGDESLSFLEEGVSIETRTRVAKSFLRQARLQGSEYFELTTGHPVRLFGVEDMALYARSLDLYRKSAVHRDGFDAYLDRIDAAVEELKPGLLNPFLLAMEEKRRRHLRQEMPPVDYSLALLREARRLGLSAPAPHLKLLEELKAIESSIDFERAQREQAAAFASLSEDDRAEMGDALKAAPAGDRKIQAAFFLSLAEKLGDLSRFPDLSRYIDYLRRSSALDARALLDEQASLERAVFARLVVSPDEAELLQCARGVWILKKLLHLQCTPEEYEEYRASRQSFGIRRLTGFLNKKIMDAHRGYDRAPYLEEGYEEAVADCEAFYELTRRRDEAFLANMDRVDDGSAVRVLITGGYHTPNLKALLKRRNVSYVCLTPQVLQETNIARYEKILLKQQMPAAFSSASPSNDMTMRTIFSGGTEALARALGLGEDRVLEAVRTAGARLSITPSASPASSGPRFTALGPNDVIIMFGSSSAAGVVDPNESVPSILSRMLGRTVVNEGVPGERATVIHGGSGVLRLPGTLDRHHPSLLVLWHGRNDVLFDREKGPSIVKGVLREMIREAQSRGIQVLLLGSPISTRDVHDVPLYRELSEEMGVPYLPDIYEGVVGRADRMHDELHANAAGNFIFAQKIEHFLRERGAVGPFQFHTFDPPVNLHTQHLGADRAVYFTVGLGDGVTAAQCRARIRSRLRDELKAAGREIVTDAAIVNDFGGGYFRFKSSVPPGTGEYTPEVSSDGGATWVPWDGYVRVGITPERQVIVVPTGLSVGKGTKPEIAYFYEKYQDVVEPIYQRAVAASGGMFTLAELLDPPYDSVRETGYPPLELYRRMMVRMAAHTVFAVSQYEVLAQRYTSRTRPDVATGDSLGLEIAMIIAKCLTIEDFIGFLRARLDLGPSIIPTQYGLVRIKGKKPDDMKVVLEPGKIEAFGYRTGNENFLIVGGKDSGAVRFAAYGIAQKLKIEMDQVTINYPIGPQIHHTQNGAEFNETMNRVIDAISFKDPQIPMLDSSDERTSILRTAEQCREAFRRTLFGPAYWTQANTLLEKSQQVWLSSEGGHWGRVESWFSGARLAADDDVRRDLSGNLTRNFSKEARVRRVLTTFWSGQMADDYGVFKHYAIQLLPVPSAKREEARRGVPGMGEFFSKLSTTAQPGAVREALAEVIVAQWFRRHVKGSKLLAVNLMLGGRELDALFWVQGHTYLPDGLYVIEAKEDLYHDLDPLIRSTINGQAARQFELFETIRKLGVPVHHVVAGVGPHIENGRMNRFVREKGGSDGVTYSLRLRLNVYDRSQNAPGRPHEETIKALAGENTDVLSILASEIPAVRENLDRLIRRYEPQPSRNEQRRSVRAISTAQSSTARQLRRQKAKASVNERLEREISGWIERSSLSPFIAVSAESGVDVRSVLRRFMAPLVSEERGLTLARAALQRLASPEGGGPEAAWNRLLQETLAADGKVAGARLLAASGSRSAVTTGLDDFLARTARPGRSMAVSFRPGEPSVLTFRAGQAARVDVYLAGSHFRSVTPASGNSSTAAETETPISALVFSMQETSKRFDRPIDAAVAAAPFEYYLHADDFMALPEADRRNALTVELRALSARREGYRRIHVVAADPDLRAMIQEMIAGEGEIFTVDEAAPPAGIFSVHSMHKSHFKDEAARHAFFEAYPGARVLTRDDLRTADGRYNLFVPAPSLVLAERVSLIADIADHGDARFREAFAYFKELVLSGYVDLAQKEKAEAELTPELFTGFLEGRLEIVRKFPLPPALRAIDLGKALRALAMAARMAAQAA